MKHRKHRAWLLCLLCLITLFALSGCGKSSPKKDAAIKEDLIAYGFEAIPGEESTLIEFAVNRRQTDKETRTDLVWCDVVYECAAKGRMLTLKLNYELFDDEGWLLQDVTIDYESESMYYPLAYPDENDDIFKFVATKANGDREKTDLYRAIANMPYGFSPTVRVDNKRYLYNAETFADNDLLQIELLYYTDDAWAVDPSTGVCITEEKPKPHTETHEWIMTGFVYYRYRDEFMDYQIRIESQLRYNTGSGCWEHTALTAEPSSSLNPDFTKQTFVLDKVSPGFGMESLQREVSFSIYYPGLCVRMTNIVRSLGAVVNDYSYELTMQPITVNLQTDGSLEYSIPISNSGAKLIVYADGRCIERNGSRIYFCYPDQLAPFTDELGISFA